MIEYLQKYFDEDLINKVMTKIMLLLITNQIVFIIFNGHQKKMFNQYLIIYIKINQICI